MATGLQSYSKRQREQRTERRRRGLAVASWVTALTAVGGFFGALHSFSHITASSSSGYATLQTTADARTSLNRGANSQSGTNIFGGGQSTGGQLFGSEGSAGVNANPSSGFDARSRSS